MKDKKTSNKTIRIFKWIGNVLLVQLILINISAAFHAYRFTHYYNDDKIRNQQPSQGKPFSPYLANDDRKKISEITYSV